MAAKGNNSKRAVATADNVSLFSRPLDWVFLLWWFNYMFTVSFTDLHNFMASYMGVEVKELEHMTFAWPPKMLTDLYFLWARTVDPLLYENPMFWQCIEWVNLIILLPASVIFFWGFVRGWNCIRLPAIIISSFTFYSVIICIGCSLFGPNPTPDVPMFIAVYQPFLLCPLAVIWRMWDDKPFSRATYRPTQQSTLRTLINFAFTVMFLASLAWYFLYIWIWFGQHTNYLDPIKTYARTQFKVEL